MMKKLLLFFLLFIVSARGISQTPEENLVKDSISVGGLYRAFEYFLPTDLASSSSLIFVLHGSNGSVARIRNFSNYEFEHIAEQRKDHIIVYPEGYENHWNDCRKNASYKANKEDVDEIAFFSGMIDYFNRSFEVNTNAVFATGVSNGGHMCYKLAYEMPDKIRGIAPFVANLPTEAYSDCMPENIATSVMIINGTADPINPYQGGWVVLGQDSTRGVVRSTEETLNYWKNLLPCKPGMEEIEHENINQVDSSTVEHYRYFCEDTKMKVELLKVVNGGHSFPLINASNLLVSLNEVIGQTNRDVNSALLVIDFFESLR